MNSGIDLRFVRETYQKMSDQDLIRILTKEATGLTPEALEIVKEEIRRRDLDQGIVRGVEAQQKSYTPSEIDAYCDIIRELPCPVTGSTSEKLNATLTGEVVSFILFTQFKKKVVIGSPAVLDKANNTALRKTLLFGWWGIPHGIIYTIRAIKINLASKKTNHTFPPTDSLRSFVLSKIGQIEAYRNNREKLLEIISGG